MKKTIILFGLMACFALGLSAQDIVGKWQAQPTSEEEGQKAVVELTFNSDKSLQMGMNVSMDDPESVEMKFHFSVSGTYTNVEDNKISFKLHPENATIGLDKLEFKGELAETLKDNSEMKEGLKKMFQQQIDSHKNEMIEEIPQEGVFTISEFTGTTMKLQISGDDDVLTFTKVQ